MYRLVGVDFYFVQDCFSSFFCVPHAPDVFSFSAFITLRAVYEDVLTISSGLCHVWYRSVSTAPVLGFPICCTDGGRQFFCAPLKLHTHIRRSCTVAAQHMPVVVLLPFSPAAPFSTWNRVKSSLGTCLHQLRQYEMVRDCLSLVLPIVCSTYWTLCHLASLLLFFLVCSLSLRPLTNTDQDVS